MLLRFKQPFKKFITTLTTQQTLNLILFLLLLLSFFYYQSHDLTNSIDGSWRYTLSLLKHTDQNLGVNIFYTYGPTFEYSTIFPTLHDSLSNFFIGLSVIGAIFTGCIYIFARWMRLYENLLRKYNLFSFVTYLLLFLLLLLTPLDSFYFVILLFAVLSIRGEKSRTRQLLLVASLTPLALYKVSFSIALMLLLPLAFAPSTFSFKQVRKSFYSFLLAMPVIAAIFAMISRSSPLGLINYYYIGFLNTLSYSEFMALPYSENFKIVAIFSSLILIVSLSVLVHSFIETKRIGVLKMVSDSYGLFATFAVLFFAYKQAVVRSDYHLFSFSSIMPILILLVVYCIKKIRSSGLRMDNYSYVIAFGVPIVIFILTVRMLIPTQGFSSYILDRTSLLTESIIKNPVSYSSFDDRRKANSKMREAIYQKDQNVANYIQQNYDADKTILFFGNTTLYGEILGLNRVSYLPFLQNYASFPPSYFDAKYIEAIRDNPEALLLLDENEASINERIPSHELNSFFQYIRQNYNLVFKDTSTRQYILEKKSADLEKCQQFSTAYSKENIAFEVETPPGSSDYVRMRINYAAELEEKVLGFLIKEPVYYITLISEDNATLVRRTTQSTLEHGIAVSPMLLSYTDLANNSPFALKKILISGGIHQDSDITVTFENCVFSPK